MMFSDILEKSQFPVIKNKKITALNKIVQEHVTLLGKEVEIKAIMKKVNNA